MIIYHQIGCYTSMQRNRMQLQTVDNDPQQNASRSATRPNRAEQIMDQLE